MADARLGRLRVAAGLAAARCSQRALAFALVCFVLGFAFGLADGRLASGTASIRTPARRSSCVLGAGVPFDLAHAVGNVVLALAVGPELRRVLERYERRLRTEVVWA